MSETIVNHGLFEGQDQMPTQMGFLPFPANLIFPPLGCHQSLKTFTTIAPSLVSSEAVSNTANLTETLLASVAQKPREDLTSTLGAGSQLLSLQRSSLNPWAWGDVSNCLGGRRSGGDNENHLGVTAMKMKKIKARRKVREPRFCFKTMSDVDVLDDGYKWRKYGQKVVKNTQHPRSYYRCTQDNCRVKKRVERLAEDPRMVITSYEGRHVHSPSNDLEDSQTTSQISNFLW
ncbi:hypothetical protein L6164_012310 [Bauhinia variegata]|uniref:Uncharacterized protein n=1 Tax=Bauhinia variegata TaxID=167791 RepID=A0ACB9P946_BAUVA|nr:hypothetical protein L6164_012310 [Bauhinia variegata]